MFNSKKIEQLNRAIKTLENKISKSEEKREKIISAIKEYFQIDIVEEDFIATEYGYSLKNVWFGEYKTIKTRFKIVEQNKNELPESLEKEWNKINEYYKQKELKKQNEKIQHKKKTA